MNELQPSSWLTSARAASQLLADRRASTTIPLLRGLDGRAPRRATMWLAVSVAVAVLLIVPISYAWVTHAHSAVVPQHLSVELPAQARIRSVSTRVMPVVIAAAPKKKPVVPQKVVVPDNQTSNGLFVEPLGEVIFVAPHVRQAPLFDAKEYKSRGVLVKPGE